MCAKGTNARAKGLSAHGQQQTRQEMKLSDASTKGTPEICCLGEGRKKGKKNERKEEGRGCVRLKRKG